MNDDAPPSLCFVQFLHPGKEHRPDGDGIRKWNQKSHRRKFLRSNGRRFGMKDEESLCFWTEWEPESRLMAKIDEPVENGPKFIYEPFYEAPSSYSDQRNTDPFVFGANFFYTGCQQYTSVGPTQLRYLERGSLILFGSCLNRRSFVLDTVFVVDKWIDHNAKNFKEVLESNVPQCYMEVTLLPWYHANCSEDSCSSPDLLPSWRLYFGATPDNPVEGMFSFFPCMPAHLIPNGFARPTISINGLITGTQTQGKKLSRVPDFRKMQEWFSDVRSQVEGQGQSLGVHAQMPEHRVNRT